MRRSNPWWFWRTTATKASISSWRWDSCARSPTFSLRERKKALEFVLSTKIASPATPVPIPASTSSKISKGVNPKSVLTCLVRGMANKVWSTVQDKEIETQIKSPCPVSGKTNVSLITSETAHSCFQSYTFYKIESNRLWVLWWLDYTVNRCQSGSYYWQ